MTTPNKYQREIALGVYVDVYDVLVAFDVTNPAIAHAIKKLLCPGQRGHKSLKADLVEAIQAINRAIELIEPRTEEVWTIGDDETQKLIGRIIHSQNTHDHP